MTYLCLGCGNAQPIEQMSLDAGGFRLCDKCCAEPLRADVDRVFAEVGAHAHQAESVCDSCGGRACNGRCGHGCR